MYKYIKRVFDIITATSLFVFISPLFFVLMVLVYKRIGSPIFFKQVRTGKNMKQFRIIKFRSMTEDRDNNGEYLPDEQRLTKLGRFLRASSLDELPELLSIIKGDMSVIGPRPLPPKYDIYYTEKEKHRFKVRGGLIPPEVLYHNIEPSWEEQLGYEAKYADELSFKVDVLILITVFKGIFRRYKGDYGEYVRKGLDEERCNNKE